MKFSIRDFFSECDQIRRKLGISSHLLKKSLMENFIFCAVSSISLFHLNDFSLIIFILKLVNLTKADRLDFMHVFENMPYHFFLNNH